MSDVNAAGPMADMIEWTVCANPLVLPSIFGEGVALAMNKNMQAKLQASLSNRIAVELSDLLKPGAVNEQAIC